MLGMMGSMVFAYPPIDEEFQGNTRDYTRDLQFMIDPVGHSLDDLIDAKGALRVFLVFRCMMVRIDEDGQVDIDRVQQIDLHSSPGGTPVMVNGRNDVPDVVRDMMQQLDNKIAEAMLEGSGFLYIRPLVMELHWFARAPPPLPAEPPIRKVARSRIPPRGPLGEPPIRRVARSRRPRSPDSGDESPSDRHFVSRYFEEERGSGKADLKGWLKKSKCLTNVAPTKDFPADSCFLLAVLRGIYYDYPDGTSKAGLRGRSTDLVEHMHEVLLPEGVTYPIPATESVFAKIEALNIGFSFSVFYLDKDAPNRAQHRYISRYRGEDYRLFHVRIGYVWSIKNGGHYVFINNFKKLLFPNRRQWIEGGYDVCECCLQICNNERLPDHEKMCVASVRDGQCPTQLRMPEERSRSHLLKFSNWEFTLMDPFVAYWDCEAFLPEPAVGGDMMPAGALNEHRPMCWSYMIRCKYAQHCGVRQCAGLTTWHGLPLGQIRYYGGPEPMAVFLNAITQDRDVCDALIKAAPFKEAARDDVVDEEKFKAELICHICKIPFDDVDMNWEIDTRHFDHDHFTGQYRGAAHPECNLRYTEKCKNYKLSCFAHNARGYDFYHALRGLGIGYKPKKKVFCIAKNTQKFTVVSIDGVSLKDSLQFMLNSLDKLVELAYKSCKDDPAKMRRTFAPVYDAFPDYPFEQHAEKLFRKAVYPYEHMKTHDNLMESMWPSHQAFYSKLRGDNISDEEYAFGMEMYYRVLMCQTMRDYTEFYVKLDVALLASIFEQFRRTGHAAFGLDPAQFVTAPSFFWNSMIMGRTQKGHLIETLTDSNMYLEFERSIMGGLSQVLFPMATANLPNLPGYNGLLPFEMIKYFDFNSMYATVMGKMKLPDGMYRWEKSICRCDIHKGNFSLDPVMGMAADKRRTIFKKGPEYPHPPPKERALWNRPVKLIQQWIVEDWDDQGDTAYFISCDVGLPLYDTRKGHEGVNLHDRFNGYPLLPMSRVTRPSVWTANQMEAQGLRLQEDGTTGTHKLVASLEPIKNRGCHIALLRHALQQGYVLEYVHKVIAFRQRNWLHDYTMKNIQRRAQPGRTEPERDFDKVASNGIFGKCIENARNRANIEIITVGLDQSLGQKVQKHGVTTVDLAGNQVKVQDPRDHLAKLAASPRLKSWTIVKDDELVVIEKHKQVTKCDRPTPVGWAILELSKLMMAEFYVQLIDTCAMCNVEVKTLYTDTDSLIVSYKSDSLNHIYQTFYLMQMEYKCFDFSEGWPADHPVLRLVGVENYHAKELGCMKSEIASEIRQFVGLRAKMYSVLTDSSDEDKKQKAKKKGLPKSLRIDHDAYLRALTMGSVEDAEITRIQQTKDLKLHTVRSSKRSLASVDDKNYYFDGQNCIRHGHYAAEDHQQYAPELDVLVSELTSDQISNLGMTVDDEARQTALFCGVAEIKQGIDSYEAKERAKQQESEEWQLYEEREMDDREAEILSTLRDRD